MVFVATNSGAFSEGTSYPEIEGTSYPEIREQKPPPSVHMQGANAAKSLYLDELARKIGVGCPTQNRR
jgi:hypothetical protein